MIDPGLTLKAVVALFAIVNPIGAAPVFLGLTVQNSPQERAKIARVASIACVIVLMGSAYVGQYVLDFFGISIASFRVIGGILFLLMSIDMLNASTSRVKQTPEEETEAESRSDIGVVPLAVPLLSGPGAISSVLLSMHAAKNPTEQMQVVVVILTVCALVYVGLRLAEPIGRMLGRTGVNIMTRLEGLIVGALAVEYIFAGTRELLPALAR